MVRRPPTRVCCPNPHIEDVNGQQTCVSCGSVHSESNIVSEISFGESASGAAVVQGSFVGEGQTYARTTGLRRGTGASGGSGLEAREATIHAGRDEMNRLAAALNIPERFVETGERWFKLAVTYNFLQGRRTQFVAASCLYIVCRQMHSSHMLIDFSDMLKINVFVLGQTFLKLIRVLSIEVPYLDPSIYIQRFARHLDFGKDTQKIAGDATRIVQRMERDWIVQGRRPSGICGACLILAARMNNQVRTVKDVMYVVKVADITIQKRLDEFKATSSSQLTVEQFRNVWLERAHDPPSFESKKLKRILESTGEEVEEPEEGSRAGPGIPIDPALSALATPVPNSPTPVPNTDMPPPSTPRPRPAGSPTRAEEEAIMAEINTELSSCLTAEIVAELSEARRLEKERQLRDSMPGSPSSIHTNDPLKLDDVDDDYDVKFAILSQEESEIKEKIWMEANSEYLQLQEEKRKKREMDEKNGVVKPTRKRRKGLNHAQMIKAGIIQPGDMAHRSLTESIPASPAESAKIMLMKRGFSSKINYKALDHLFDD